MATVTAYPLTHLLGLPLELRQEIYRLLLNPDASRVHHEDEYTSYNFAPALKLFMVNRQVYHEARKIFHDLNNFVRIETPWPEAQSHVALEGHVPILVSKARASSFKDYSLNITIDAPEHTPSEWDTQCFVILADDLPKFTDMWFYSDLSHPGLNEHLRLDLQLRDPHAQSWEEQRMPRALQSKLLLPFGIVKNLYKASRNQPGTIISGPLKPFASIEKEMRKLQEEPHKSPEHCLREATRLKFEGNAELTKGNYRAALQLYNEAWKAMHIVIKGRQRHLHADKFFGRDLREDPFVGKDGQAERLMLRVRLVANTCLAYLKLGDYEETVFWGNRSICMLREAIGTEFRGDIPPQEEAILGFPAANQMGKIYYRTAVAYKEMGDKSEARKLLRVAQVYLPHDENVRKEIAATALQLG